MNNIWQYQGKAEPTFVPGNLSSTVNRLGWLNQQPARAITRIAGVAASAASLFFVEDPSQFSKPVSFDWAQPTAQPTSRVQRTIPKQFLAAALSSAPAESIYVDKWHPPIGQPTTRVRSVNQDTSVYPFRVTTLTPFEWVQPTAEPAIRPNTYRQKISFIGSLSSISASESITVDKWIQPTSQPRPKAQVPAQKPYYTAFLTDLVTPPVAIPIDRWGQPTSEPTPRTRPSPQAAFVFLYPFLSPAQGLQWDPEIGFPARAVKRPQQDNAFFIVPQPSTAPPDNGPLDWNPPQVPTYRGPHKPTPGEFSYLLPIQNQVSLDWLQPTNNLAPRLPARPGIGSFTLWPLPIQNLPPGLSWYQPTQQASARIPPRSNSGFYWLDTNPIPNSPPPPVQFWFSQQNQPPRRARIINTGVIAYVEISEIQSVDRCPIFLLGLS